MANEREHKIVTSRFGDFETAGTKFEMTMDPRSKIIKIEDKEIGRIMWHNGNFVLNINCPMTMPLSFVADVLRERARIQEELESRPKD